MNYLFGLLIAIYITIIVSLIWARFQFFNIKSASSKTSSRLYDPVVGIQIATTLYFMLSGSPMVVSAKIFGLLCYVLSLVLFWWSIVTAKKLEFAFSNNVGKVVTTGPFAFIRHPFYTSYFLVWFGSSILFNSIFLWITLIYLVSFYITSAKTEEEVYLKSEYSREYRDYSKNVGMFLPRIALWKK